MLVPDPALFDYLNRARSDTKGFRDSLPPGQFPEVEAWADKLADGLRLAAEQAGRTDWRPIRRALDLTPTEPIGVLVAAAERLTGMPVSDLACEFVSLGCDCELGQLQRDLRAEPLGLLRWANFPVAPLLASLRDRFALLDQGPVELFNQGRDARHVPSGMIWHTMKEPDEVASEQFVASEARRLRRLGDKLLEDISDSTRIFVVWSTELPLQECDALAVFHALRQIGPRATLLYVVTGKPHGLVEEMVPGLLRGRIDRWLDERLPIPERYSTAGWLAVLVNAWRLHAAG